MYDDLRLTTALKADTAGPQTAPFLDRASELGARFAATGEVRREGDTLIGTMRLLDVKTRTTIFQTTREASASNVTQGSLSLGRSIADRTSCAIAILNGFADKPPDPSVLPLIGNACTATGARVTNAERELSQRAPANVVAQARFAEDLVFFLPQAPEAMQPAMLMEADQALARAEALDPAAYATAIARAAVAVAHDKPPLAWAPDLERALQRAPREGDAVLYARANGWTGAILLILGRTKNAAAYFQVAADSNPNSAWRFERVIAVRASGQFGAKELLDDLLKRQLGDYNWEIALGAAIFLDITNPEDIFAVAPPSVKAAVPCYRDLLGSLKSTDRKRRLAGARKADACLTEFNSPHVNMQAQSMLGDLDRAFVLADRPDFTRFIWSYYSPLFLRSTKAMRADPRFLPLMEKIGYVDYWKQTKTKPDVCSTPEESSIPLCTALQ
jgi:tetratricopeptide (TPR) repeat protein